ncbi:MAG: NADAR family protein [Pseudomonadota bacterium]|nr:NADAR family protein [Pseudomonadota bacterium]
MALFPKLADDAIYLDRGDPTNPLASYSRHGFELEGCDWPSVEHYFQAMKFDDPVLRARVRLAPNPAAAARIARWRFWRVRKDWKKVQLVMMTRGTWIKCHAHPEVAAALLDTGERMIVESSLYDYYWGCGRDQRGHNYYGKMLMDVREKLRAERRQGVGGG